MWIRGSSVILSEATAARLRRISRLAAADRGNFWGTAVWGNFMLLFSALFLRLWKPMKMKIRWSSSLGELVTVICSSIKCEARWTEEESSVDWGTRGLRRICRGAVDCEISDNSSLCLYLFNLSHVNSPSLWLVMGSSKRHSPLKWLMTDRSKNCRG